MTTKNKNKKPFDPKKAAAMRKAGKTIREVGAYFGISESYAHARMRKAGLTSVQGSRRSAKSPSTVVASVADANTALRRTKSREQIIAQFVADMNATEQGVQFVGITLEGGDSSKARVAWAKIEELEIDA